MKKILSFCIAALVIFLSGCSHNSDNTPDKIVLKSGNMQCVQPGTKLPKDLVIEVLGPNKKGLLGGKGTRNPVKNVEIHFEVSGSNTNIFFPDGNSIITDDGGRAAVSPIIGNTVGDIYVKAYFTKKDGKEKSVTFRLISGIVLIGDDQEAFANQACPKPVGVKLFSPDGNPLQNAKVFFTVQGGKKEAVLTTPETVTGKDGTATTLLTVGKKTHSIHIIAEIVSPDGKSLFRSVKLKVMSVNRTLFFITLLGGLAIFIFGMKTMSDGLHHVAGTKMKSVLQFFTSNRFVGVLAGMGITAAIQSSSACTVMVVGFVNAGLLSLQQAITIVFGSNIGTTVTAQIIAFKLDNLALPAVIIGLVMQMVCKKNTTKFWGQVLLGFGLLFFGMHMMSGTLKPLRTSPTFISFFHGFDCSPVNGVMPLHSVLQAIFIGTMLTVVVQSSSATVGLVMALAASGLINFYTAVPLVLGDNIGTTITANLAALGGSRNARRTAIAHTLFNLLGTSIMVLLFYVPYHKTPIFLYFINWITPGNALGDEPVNIARNIAMAHSVFNITCVFIFVPFTRQLAWLCERIIPIKPHELEERSQYLEPHLLNTPSIAIVQAARELAYMTRRAMKMVEDSYKCLRNKSLKWEDDVRRREEIVDSLQEEISDYLSKLSSRLLTEKEAQTIPVLMHAVHDVERIGDLAINILELADRCISKKIKFSEETLKDLDEMFETVDSQCNHVFEGLTNANLEAAQLCLAEEDKINALQKRLASGRIKSFDPKNETVRNTVLVLDVLANFERIGDHLANIAERIPVIASFEPGANE